MKNFIKYASLLLSVIFAFSFAAACGGENEGAESASDGGSASVVDKTDDFIVRGGKSNYTIVVSDDPSLPETTAAQS